jgi:nucleotide-binding universal stress UspA family protein
MGNSGSEEGEPDSHLGSVAHRVTLSFKKSILIVRNKKEIKKILVPVDGTSKEEKALQKAHAIAKASGSSAILLHAQEASIRKLRPEINEIGLQILDHMSKSMTDLQFEKKLVPGDPANVIIETAKKEDADLIVLSKGELGSLRGLFLGSVSDHVLHHATVPVLLVK